VTTPRPSVRDVLRPPAELMLVCLQRAGGFRGVRLASFVNDWAIEEHRLGRQIGIEEFIRSWSAGKQKTAYNRQREFRAAFPELGPDATPHDLIVWSE
jgi:hypothetical protein